MNRIRRISVIAAITLEIGVGSFAGVGMASADPTVCGGPIRRRAQVLAH